MSVAFTSCRVVTVSSFLSGNNKEDFGIDAIGSCRRVVKRVQVNLPHTIYRTGLTSACDNWLEQSPIGMAGYMPRLAAYELNFSVPCTMRALDIVRRFLRLPLSLALGS